MSAICCTLEIMSICLALFPHTEHSNKYCMYCSPCCPTLCHSSCFAARGLRRLHFSPLYLTSAINNSAKECTELKIGGDVRGRRVTVDGTLSFTPLPPSIPVVCPHASSHDLLQCCSSFCAAQTKCIYVPAGAVAQRRSWTALRVASMLIAMSQWNVGKLPQDIW